MKNILLILTVLFYLLNSINIIQTPLLFSKIGPDDNITFSSKISPVIYKNKVSQTKLNYSEKLITIKSFFKGSKEFTAILTGKGNVFVSDTEIAIYDDNKRLYTFSIPEGYSPRINFYRFTENESFLFYSAQSSGSGGYGYYMIYRINEDGYNIVYNWETDNSENYFKAFFDDGGKMVLCNVSSGTELSVDINYLDKEYYNKIYSEEGKVKNRMHTVNVNCISSVFPYYNSSLDIYQLITYRSVTAIAEVNRIGYVTQNLVFDGNRFVPYLTDFTVNIK